MVKPMTGLLAGALHLFVVVYGAAAVLLVVLWSTYRRDWTANIATGLLLCGAFRAAVRLAEAVPANDVPMIAVCLFWMSLPGLRLVVTPPETLGGILAPLPRSRPVSRSV